MKAAPARTLVGMNGITSQPADPTTAGSATPDLSSLHIAVIGAGNMGGPVVRTFLDAGAAPTNVHIVNSTPASSQRAAAELGAQATPREQALSGADVVVLGVKPYQILDLLAELRAQIPADAVVISLAAGTTLEALEQALPDGQPVLRAMPNTPIAVGEGAVGLMRGTTVSDEAHARVHALFSRAGVAVDITEDQVHAFIAAAGSMPALEYALIESMIDESVRQGLARDLAASLVQQTVRGAATVLQETGVHAAIARNSATSPAGTTAEALAEFDRHGVRAGIAASMAAAEERSRAMSGD